MPFKFNFVGALIRNYEFPLFDGKTNKCYLQIAYFLNYYINLCNEISLVPEDYR